MELFKKIFIKNSEDLPKDDKPYICHVKTSNETGHLSWLPVKGNEGIWEMVDWYLQPTEIKFPSEKILNKKSIEYAIVEVDNDEGGTDKFVSPIAEYYIDGFNDAINWIRENNIKNERWHNGWRYDL